MFLRFGAVFVWTICACARLCPDDKYNLEDIRCCSKCSPGYGVRRDCGYNNDTYCEPCLQSQTYSPHLSHTERCRQCRQCGPDAIIKRPCNRTHDTICGCKKDFYYDSGSGQCKSCDPCPEGFGVQTVCNTQQNTLCIPCRNGTYSDISSKTQDCKTCSTCSEGEAKLAPCESKQDTICFKKLDVDSPRSTDTSDDQPGESSNTGAELIPLYCAIMGLVVVALLAYAIYKHMKLRGKKRRAAYLEKEAAKRTGSDSGVYLDQENKLYANNTKVRDLPPAKKKELEVVLTNEESGRNWTHLAKELGYNSKKIEGFQLKGQGEEEAGMMNEDGTPVRYLLVEWGKNDSATIGVLVRALKNIGRQDVLKVLQGEPLKHSGDPQSV